MSKPPQAGADFAMALFGGAALGNSENSAEPNRTNQLQEGVMPKANQPNELLPDQSPKQKPTPPEPEKREGALTDEEISHENPGAVVIGSDSPGGGGTRPLEFDQQGRAIPPAKQGRHGGQEESRS